MGWGVSQWGNSGWESTYPTTEPEQESLGVEFDCIRYNISTGISRPGVIIITSGISGDLLSRLIISSAIEVTTGNSGTFSPPVVIVADAISMTLTQLGSAWIISNTNAWVWAGKIGEMNFVQDTGGIASRFPMSYTGILHKMLKLGNSVIVYASNGVTRIAPHSVDWSRVDLHFGGILGRNAACGDEHKQFFIDKIGLLWKLLPDTIPERIDYSNTLSAMQADTVMSYDRRLDIVYITDGTNGYALTQDGLGKCPPTITGVGYRDGIFYISSPITIVNSPLEIATDTLDFSSRYEKTIDEIDIGTTATEEVYVAIDYRNDKSAGFTSSSWRRVQASGHVPINITAIEFRIKVKLTTYEDINIDYINILGSYIDTKPIEGIPQ